MREFALTCFVVQASALSAAAASRPDGDPPPSWTVGVFLLGFPLFWCLVLGVLSLLSGWRSLASRYRHLGPPPEARMRMQSAKMGHVQINNVLTLGHDEDALYLAVFILFRPFTPPLKIPWTAIVRRTRARAILFEYDTLEIEGDRRVQLRLRPGQTAPFEAYLPESNAREWS